MGARPGMFQDDNPPKKSSEQKMPEGSWKCGKCKNINYPFRTKCNRQNCGGEKPSDSSNSPMAAASEEDYQVLNKLKWMNGALLAKWYWRYGNILVNRCPHQGQSNIYSYTAVSHGQFGWHSSLCLTSMG